MKSFRGLILLICCSIPFSILFSAQAQTVPQEKEKQLLAVFHSISSHDLLATVDELCSEKYDGRLPGSPGYLKAAEWVEERLKKSGLTPAGDQGTFLQNFPQPYCVIKNPGSLSLVSLSAAKKKTEKKYLFPENYYPGFNSASGTVTGEVIYAGYGITAPKLKYDDYKGVNVKGKIVLVDSGIPYEKDDDNQEKWGEYSSSVHKLKNALKHGASGMLYIGKTANANTVYQPGFLYCHVDENVVNDFFAETGKIYKDLKAAINKRMKPASFSTKKNAVMAAVTEYHPEGTCCNVLALIPGTDSVLKDDVIIFGGHLDGQGNPGQLFPSALDNASGVADMIAAAEALGSYPIKPKRSILFLFFGGEESGLHGSRLYCQKPLFPREKTIGMFNLDMVGNGQGLSLRGGLSYPLIQQIFEESNQKYLHRNLKSSEARKPRGRPRSDGAVFAREGFRTFGIGTSEPVKEVFYHDLRDTAAMLTPEIMEDVAKWIFLSAISMANAERLQ